MALEKSLLTSFGYPATYWKISTVFRVNAAGNPVKISIDGYKDADARNAVPPAAPMDTRTYQASGADLDAIEASDEISAAYVWLKANVPDFADAMDV